jgi:hypothetical protein
MTHTTTVLRLKTAKAIINRCYEADKSAAISSDGLAVHGNSIDAIVSKITDVASGGYTVTINSMAYDLSTLQYFVDEVFADIAAGKSAR